MSAEIMVNCKYYLKLNYLKDPDNYDSMEWSDIIIVDRTDYRYMIRHKYRARNSFGGYVIENKLFYLDKEGNVVNMKNYNW